MFKNFHRKLNKSIKIIKNFVKFINFYIKRRNVWKNWNNQIMAPM